MRDKKLPILTQIESFRTVTPIWIHRWIWNDAQSIEEVPYCFSRSSNKSIISPWTKWLPIRRWCFQMHFHEWKVYFESTFTEIWSQGHNQQYSSINSDNGLAPIRRQAIILINTVPSSWRIYECKSANSRGEMSLPRSHSGIWRTSANSLWL